MLAEIVYSSAIIFTGETEWINELNLLHIPLTPSWVHAELLSHVQLFVTPRIVAHQIPLSMGFSRQEYWSGLPFPSPGDLPDSGIQLCTAGRFFTVWATREALSPHHCATFLGMIVKGQWNQQVDMFVLDCFFHCACDWEVYFPESLSLWFQARIHQQPNLYDIWKVLVSEETLRIWSHHTQMGRCRGAYWATSEELVITRQVNQASPQMKHPLFLFHFLRVLTPIKPLFISPQS